MEQEAMITIAIFILTQIISVVYQKGKAKEQSDVVVSRLDKFDIKFDRYNEKQHQHELHVSANYVTTLSLAEVRNELEDYKKYVSAKYPKQAFVEMIVESKFNKLLSEERLPKGDHNG